MRRLRLIPTCWLAAVSIAVVIAHAPARAAAPRAAASPPAVTLEAPRHLMVRDYKPRVILGWTYDGAGATGFQVERAIVAGAPHARPDHFTPVGAPGREARTFRDPSSHAGMTYVYRIRAVGRGTVSPYSKELIVRVSSAAR